MHAVPSSTDTIPGKMRGDWTPINYDLRDTWFPVSHSRDLSARPIRRIIHAQPSYLWRDNGRAVAAEFNPRFPVSYTHLTLPTKA